MYVNKHIPYNIFVRGVISFMFLAYLVRRTNLECRKHRYINVRDGNALQQNRNGYKPVLCAIIIYLGCGTQYCNARYITVDKRNEISFRLCGRYTCLQDLELYSYLYYHLAIRLMATGNTFSCRDPNRYSLIFSEPKSCFRVAVLLLLLLIGRVGSTSSIDFLVFL